MVFVITSPVDGLYEEHIIFPIEAEEFESFGPYVQLLKEHPKKRGVVFMSEKPSDMLNVFIKGFNEIKAAGGLVVNQSGQALLIRRRGLWDLPKGKVEEGEFMRQAALREVKEECGVQQIKIKSTIKPTFHIYELDGNLVLKTTYWYQMFCEDPESAVPQAEEDITEVRWVDRKELAPYVEETFPNIKIILALFASDVKDYGRLDQ